MLLLHNVGKTNIVDWQAGYDMFALEHVWKWTGEERYARVAGHVRDGFDGYPRTAEVVLKRYFSKNEK